MIGRFMGEMMRERLIVCVWVGWRWNIDQIVQYYVVIDDDEVGNHLLYNKQDTHPSA